jgi:hypothetical protein
MVLLRLLISLLATSSSRDISEAVSRTIIPLPWQPLFKFHKQQINMLLQLEFRSGIRDRRCGLVVIVPGNRSRGPGFDSRFYWIF